MTSSPPRPTRVIGGRYVVLAELGRGGMGVVWRAEDRVMGRHVAVKELHLPIGLSSQERLALRERLLREARTAGRLNHPGIVTVFDVISDEGPDGVVRDHIVMELIEADTLADVVSRSGPLDERTATSVARQLLDALGAAHDKDVVHRDVKPSNVMLGTGGRVTLTDFGIAQAAEDPRLTTTGSLVGSPGYMAPERLEGRQAGAASDLWGLGATLFHAVQGAGPFARDTTPATIFAVLHAEIPPVRTRGPLGPVIGGLLQRAPQARLGGRQAAALLEPAGGPMPSADPAAPPATRRRRTWPLVVAALVVGLLLGLLGGATLARGGGSRGVAAFTYGTATTDGDLPAFDFTSPACLSVRPGRNVAVNYGTSVECAQPHLSELFAVRPTFGSGDAIPYPGVDALSALAVATCRSLFDSGLVVGQDKSSLAVVAIVPSQPTFEHNGGSPGSTPSYSDRDLYCVVQRADGTRLTGSRLAPEPG